MKRIGPELRKPDLTKLDLKVPPVLRDLYWDLRDRRLLPLVALAVVAIIAVPFLLGESAESPPSATTSPADGVAAEASASSAELTVVKAAPGLRAPHKRLSRLRAKDPFKQHYTNAPVAPDPTAVSTSSTSISTTGVDTEEVPGSPAGSVETGNQDGGASHGGSGSPDGGAGAPAPGDLVFYTFAVDVRIVRTETKEDGSKETSEPQVRERVLPSTSLPGDKAQVVTYMGISPKTRKPLFLVSTDVSAVFGDAKCVAGSDSCQLLELDPELPETFLYGENDVRYKINVLKIEPVATGHS